MKKTQTLIALIFISIISFAQDCNLNEEAKKHWYRAETLIGMTEKEKDYNDVVLEYKKAAEYAPDCPNIYYNLGLCQEMLCKSDAKNCDAAISNLKKYLELNSNASDKEEVQAKIYGIEVKKEKFEKEQKFEQFVGVWKRSNGDTYEIYKEDEKLKTKVLTSMDFNCYNSDDGWQHGYDVIQITINKDCMILDYKSKSTFICYNKKNQAYVKTTVFSYEYNLCIVSSSRLEGTCHLKIDYNDKPSERTTEKIYFEKQ